jgi:hypothetical protein
MATLVRRPHLKLAVLVAGLSLVLTACPEEDAVEDPLEDDPVEEPDDNDVMDDDDELLEDDNDNDA